MKIKSVLLLAGLGMMGQALADAPRNPISVHVLNTQTGKPSSGVKVELAQQHQATFFPDVPVNFQVSNTQEHYHIPLLLSQYGYSTYRGS